MIAAIILVMFTLGIYGLIIESYNMTARIRYRDDARAVLLTFADQFERLQTTTEVKSMGKSYARWLFNPTPGGPDGAGLRWGALCDEDAFNNPLPSPVPTFLNVTLGDTNDMALVGTKNPIIAHVTRAVYYVTSTGDASAVQPSTSITAAGWLIVGTFTISYTANGRAEKSSITVTRSVP